MSYECVALPSYEAIITGQHQNKINMRWRHLWNVNATRDELLLTWPTIMPYYLSLCPWLLVPDINIEPSQAIIAGQDKVYIYWEQSEEEAECMADDDVEWGATIDIMMVGGGQLSPPKCHYTWASALAITDIVPSSTALCDISPFTPWPWERRWNNFVGKTIIFLTWHNIYSRNNISRSGCCWSSV